MSIADLEHEIQSLDQPMQKRLMGFLVSLQLKHDDAWKVKTAAKLDSRSADSWVSIEEAETRLDLESDDAH